MSALIRAAWAYRNFIITSVKNEFISNFIRSRLGGLWMVIEPLVMVAIYAVILSAVLGAKLPGLEENRFGYAIYLVSGIACWELFSNVIIRSLNMFIANGNLMKKVVFPKVCLPCITVGTALVNNILFIFAGLFIFLLVGHWVTWQIIYLPVLVALTAALGLGFGLIFGILNVFIRDVGQAVPLILQIGFWGTPIVYPVSIVPDQVKFFLQLNPVFYLVQGYRNVLAFGEPVQWFPLLGLAGMAAVLLAAAFWMFRQASPEMVDVL
ncbi:lipopolysaccharide transport system permease protein [Desulfosalsimonas propionicica]|uniref:Transport permease protein n=1 Tax=Desulfosalsimonas propionicica TaxID=332175 RepID=A0A7W0C6B1_9BACT|nr:ABC transporter permease [Desulfosalsimonas propionicica]MBA2880003.1 lipopolysaccharide transport system permease protein [Desulfosalsimonas propionicica]